jgi:NAD(P)-dependent dehydrogenase (short-subunit alcohol dehydrogenase family)
MKIARCQYAPNVEAHGEPKRDVLASRLVYLMVGIPTAGTVGGFDFGGSPVLVNGGSGGIGNAIAAFAKAGTAMTVAGTRPSAEDDEADGSAFSCQQLSDPASIGAVANSLEALDILVNNARGIGVNRVTPGLTDTHTTHPAMSIPEVMEVEINRRLRIPHGLNEKLRSLR